jgi:phosphatidylinositol glycan class W
MLRRQRQGRQRKDSESSSGSSGPESPDAPIPVRKPAHKALQRENDKTATELISYSVVWWAMLGLARLVNIGGGISRRMVGKAFSRILVLLTHLCCDLFLG